MKKYFADIVIIKERLSTGKPVFVAHCTNLGIASQGETTDDAIKNVKEAIQLYLEEQPEKADRGDLSEEPPVFSVVEVTMDAKAACAVR